MTREPTINAWRLGQQYGEASFSAYLSGPGIVAGRYSLPLSEAIRTGDALQALVDAALAGRAKLVAWRGK